MVQDDPPQGCRKGLVPAGRLGEPASKYWIVAVERVRELERISNTKIADQDRSRGLATVDGLLEAGFPLQKAHRRRRGAVQAFTLAENTHRVQFQFVVLGHKWDRDLARAAQRRCIIDHQSTADVDDGCALDEILSISQSEHD
jgi:hypothetical protein